MSKMFLTLDFETFFAPKYSLKALGPSAYVRDERFEFLSVALKQLGKDTVSVGGSANVRQLIQKLKPHQDRIVLCGHNLYFDAFILSHHFNFIPAYYVDTLCMGNVLDAHLGPLDLDTLAKRYLGAGKVEGVLDQWKSLDWENATEEQRQLLLHYNEIDVERTEGIAIKMMEKMPRCEMDVIDRTLRMFTEPTLEIDAELAREIYDEAMQAKQDAADAVGVPQSVFRSNDKFAQLLEDEGYDVPYKKNDKGKDIPALAAADLPFQKMLEHGDDRLKALCETRKICKSSITTSRAKGLLDRSAHRFPVGLMYASAHTMRWGGTDKMNPQNLPRNGRLRHCLRAQKGYVLVIVDASQIEARDNAVFSEQWDLVEAFASGVDVYCDFASDLYGYEVNKNDHWEERYVGKTCILGLGYQMGVERFQNTLETGQMGPPLEISLREAERAVYMYRDRYPQIVRHWRVLGDLIVNLMEGGREVEHRGVVIRPGEVLMPNGLCLHYPGVGYTINPTYNTPDFYYEPWNKKYRMFVRDKLYGGLFLENLVQCRARIMTTEHMMTLSKWYRPVLMAHDEIVFHVPVAQADKCLEHAIEVMSVPPRWNEKCPLAAEGSIQDHYVKD